MKCLYCGKRVLAFRLFSGGEVFCSEEHGNIYRKRAAESAIERILRMDGQKKPLRMAQPALALEPVLPEEPTAVEVEPSAAGFRMPVIEAMAWEPSASTVAWMPSLAVATEVRPSPVRLAELVIAEPLVSFWPEWRATAAETELRQEIILPTQPNVPALLSAGVVWAPVSRGTSNAWWQALPERASMDTGGVRVSESLSRLRLDLDTGKLPVSLGLTTSGAAPLASYWREIGEQTAVSESAQAGAGTATAIAFPYLAAERFSTSWTAGRATSLWTPRPGHGGQSLIAFDSDSTARTPLRHPAASAERQAQPKLLSTALLWRASAEISGEVATLRAAGDRVQVPGLLAERARFAPAGAASVRGWELRALRPVAAVYGVRFEGPSELSLWTAWPEYPPLSHAPARAVQPAPLNWQGQTTGGLKSGRNSALRLLDVPERCLRPGLERASLNHVPALPGGTLTKEPMAGRQIAASYPSAAVRMPDLSLPSLAAPGETTLRSRSAVGWVINGQAPAPEAGAGGSLMLVTPESGPLATPQTNLVSTSRDPRPAGSTPWLLAAQTPAAAIPVLAGDVVCRRDTLLPASCGAETVIAGAGFARPAQPWVALGLSEEAGGEPEEALDLLVRCLEDARGLAVPADPVSAQEWPAKALWGHAGDERALDATLQQRREPAPRLAVQEMPVRTEIGLPGRAAQPGSANWTFWALVAATGPRESLEAALAPMAQALRHPPVTASLTAKLTPARGATPSWSARMAAADPVAPRRRQLPGSRPKMNLPRAITPQQAIAVSEVSPFTGWQFTPGVPAVREAPGVLEPVGR